jgi:CheY-like chemotaxis protein
MLDIVSSIKEITFIGQDHTNHIMPQFHFQNNSNAIDLVLCDIRMPKMNGYELVKRANSAT